MDCAKSEAVDASPVVLWLATICWTFMSRSVATPSASSVDRRVATALSKCDWMLRPAVEPRPTVACGPNICLSVVDVKGVEVESTWGEKGTGRILLAGI